MSFYDPMQAGPDFGGGISELLNMFIMFKMLEGMYPEDKKGEKEGKGMPDIANMFMGESPLPPQREMPMGGQPPMGQPQGIEQIMQMLGIPGLMK